MRSRVQIEDEYGAGGTIKEPVLEVLLDNRELLEKNQEILMENRKLYIDLLEEVKRLLESHNEEMRLASKQLLDK